MFILQLQVPPYGFHRFYRFLLGCLRKWICRQIYIIRQKSVSKKTPLAFWLTDWHPLIKPPPRKALAQILSLKSMTCFFLFLVMKQTMVVVVKREGDKPIQHSIRAHGETLMTSGGSTPTFRHKTNATHPVFTCPQQQQQQQQAPHPHEWNDTQRRSKQQKKQQLIE